MGAATIANLAGYQRDEVYIGTAEERAAKNLGDDQSRLNAGKGHIVPLPAYVDNAPKALIDLMGSDEGVKEFVRQLSLHGGDLEKYVEGLKNKAERTLSQLIIILLYFSLLLIYFVL